MNAPVVTAAGPGNSSEGLAKIAEALAGGKPAEGQQGTLAKPMGTTGGPGKPTKARVSAKTAAGSQKPRSSAKAPETDAATKANAAYNAMAGIHADRSSVATDDMVDVDVPTAFNLTDDSHVMHRISAGPQRMPRAHAEHVYAKAHGVTIGKAK